MDVKLDSLIEKIKKDGLDEAKKVSQDIIQKAEGEAKAIVARAKAQSKTIVAQGQQEAQKLKKNTESSLRQAARDLLIGLRNEINSLLARLIKQRVAKEFEPALMAKLIVAIVGNWSKAKGADLEVLVNKADKQKLESLLYKELKDRAREKIEIKINKTIDKGFRIGIKGDDLYYDFTDEALSETFKEFLNPAIGAMLDTK